MTEEEFLKNYDSNQFFKPSVTVDSIISYDSYDGLFLSIGTLRCSGFGDVPFFPFRDLGTFFKSPQKERSTL